jgi:hypothetical protein
MREQTRAFRGELAVVGHSGDDGIRIRAGKASGEVKRAAKARARAVPAFGFTKSGPCLLAPLLINPYAMSAVQQPLLDTIEPDDDAPVEAVQPKTTTARQPVVLTPTNRAAEGVMASNQGDAESGVWATTHLATLAYLSLTLCILGVGAIFRQAGCRVY